MPINAQILDNPKSDRVRRIADLTRAKGRERSGRFLIEGPQSVREAVTWRPDVVQDLYVEVSQALEHPRIISSTLEKIVETSQDATIYVHYCTGDVMRRISPDAQGIAAVGNAESMHAGADDVELGKNGRAPQIAAFWQVRDPGNAGTVIRCADAFGADGVILTSGSVEIYNPKTVRSTVGSLFHMPILTGIPLADAVAKVKAMGMTVLAADGDGEALDLKAAAGELSGPIAWIMGNEAWGLPAEDARLADEVVAVPMWGQAESLNLSSAAAVCLYATASAQRR